MTAAGTLRRMLASEPRELGDRRRKMRQDMATARDGMTVLDHRHGEMTTRTTKTTIVLVDGKEVGMITASPMEAPSTGNPISTKESKTWNSENKMRG